ncbi:MAG TPA: outer membrane beta-barrel protein [Bacteroidia bacterium]|nr:outer membrane beta-barrel protein [Bacteroidia bacterium]
MFSQTVKVSGQLIDATDKSPLIGAVVVFINQADTTQQTGVAVDINGNFTFNITPGIYKLRAELITYKSLELRVTANSSDINLGSLTMQQAATVLKETVVEAKQTHVEQLGDTTQIHADAYKSHPDATAEDLVNKMPGISTTTGSVTVNGEQVKQILVDGKPFFGDDPNLAIKNLPADIIDKIQVFDKASDQAQFTGFDDGNAQKTINIITKKGKNNGQFGKIYAGGGVGDNITDDKYNAGGNMNFFNGSRRISIVELSNNINQQNFSSQDLLGISSGSGGGGRGGGGNAANNFLVSQQGGITTTHAAGLNYSDEWGKKIKITGSYFFNYADNTNNSTLSRNYIIAKENGLHYDQVANAGSINQNHRVNFRFEYTIDSMNSLIIVPKFSIQQNRSNSDLSGVNLISGDTAQSKTATNNYSKNFGYDFSNTITLRHKFKKPRRTISLGVSTDYNPTNNNGSLYSSNIYYQLNYSTLLNQQNTGNNLGLTISPNLSYTEPLGKKSQLMLTYNPSINKSTIDKRTSNKDSLDVGYNQLDTILSNQYSNTYTYQRGGVSYRFTDKKLNFMLGANAQYALLSGTEQFPYALSINKNFESILPQVMFNYKFSKTKNLRFTYRTNTSPPGISQLQNVINNSNPLLLSTGNPNLKQDYEQTLNLRYGSVNSAKATNFMLYAMVNSIQNYVANSTLIPTQPTQISGSSVILRPGSQLSKPVNLNGYWNARSFITYGFPISKIKMNLNLNTGFTYNLIPDLINEQENLANNYNFSEGLVLSSNISQKVDFSLSYTGNYSIVKNTLQKQSDNNYFNQVTTFKFNWLPYKGIIFNTNLTHTLYTGLAQSYNQSYFLWNVALGYKFLKSQALDVRVSVFDALKQNNSINRNVTDTYIEDSHTQVLTRYYMLTLTYTIKNFKNGTTAPTENTDKPDGFRRGDGGGGGYRPDGGGNRGGGGNY